MYYKLFHNIGVYARVGQDPIYEFTSGCMRA